MGRILAEFLEGGQVTLLREPTSSSPLPPPAAWNIAELSPIKIDLSESRLYHKFLYSSSFTACQKTPKLREPTSSSPLPPPTPAAWNIAELSPIKIDLSDSRLFYSFLYSSSFTGCHKTPKLREPISSPLPLPPPAAWNIAELSPIKIDLSESRLFCSFL